MMPPKNAMETGSVLSTLYPNQGDEALVREARNQKRKAVNLEPQDEELDCGINNSKKSTNNWRSIGRRCFVSLSFRRILTKHLKRCVTFKCKKIRTTTRTRTMRAIIMTTFVLNHSTSKISFMTKLHH
jgi:hypothetical protein